MQTYRAWPFIASTGEDGQLHRDTPEVQASQFMAGISPSLGSPSMLDFEA